MASKAKAKVTKLKSNRGAAKRFKKTAGGLKKRSSHRNHILTKKAHKRKRQLRTNGMVCKSDAPGIERLLHGS